MKNGAFVFIASLIIVLPIMGFQCGSAEMTSARMYLQRSDWANAERSLEQEVAKNPNNAEAWYLLGQTRFNQKNYKGMNEAFTRSLTVGNQFEKDIKSDRLVAWGRLMNSGVSYFNKGRSEGSSIRINMSKEDVRKILGEPSSVNKTVTEFGATEQWVYPELIYLYFDDGVLKGWQEFNKAVSTGGEKNVHLEKAIEDLQLALVIVPDSAITYKNLAYSYLLLKDYNNALQNFELALQREKDPEVALPIGSMYSERVRKFQNDAKSVKGVKKDSLLSLSKTSFDKAILMLEKGEAYAQERLEKIDSAIQKIARIEEPRSEEYRKQLDEFEIQKAEIDKLLANLTATRLDTYLAAGRVEEATNNFKLAVEKSPNNKLYRYNYGVLLLKARDYKNSVEQFEAAVVADPTFEDAYYNLGVAYLQWGAQRRSDAESSTRSGGKRVDKTYEEQFRLAKETLERLRDMKPNDPDVWEALGQAYGQLNMQKQATGAFSKADDLRKGK